jgi:hypothetical protein
VGIASLDLIMSELPEQEVAGNDRVGISFGFMPVIRPRNSCRMRSPLHPDRVEFDVTHAGQQICIGQYAGYGRQAKAWMALPGCGKQAVGNPVAGLYPPGVDQGNQGQ